MKKILFTICAVIFCCGLFAQQNTVVQYELTGNLSFNVSDMNGLVGMAAITIGDGGTGPYKAWMVGDTTIKTHTIYRPADLSPFGSRQKLAIVVWGNGGCRNGSGEVRNFLSEIASHGFLVIAVGPFTNALSNTSERASDSRLLLDAIDWAISENNRQGSPYYQRIETTKIAAMGQSCGGLMALDVLTDSRITTVVLWNSGFIVPAAAAPGVQNQQQASSITSSFRTTKDDLQKLHGPVAYFTGGESDGATANAADDFARINHVPAVFASYDFTGFSSPWGYGHYPCTYREPNGGDFAIAGVAWLKWQLKNDKEASRMFTGIKPSLLNNPNWTLEKKNIE